MRRGDGEERGTSLPTHSLSPGQVFCSAKLAVDVECLCAVRHEGVSHRAEHASSFALPFAPCCLRRELVSEQSTRQQGRAGQGRAGQGREGKGRREQKRAEQERTEQKRREENRTEENRTEENRRVENRTEQNRTEQNRREEKRREHNTTQ